jgi:predicted metal-dependent enzyme (double-stranded beta helix superfamily)
MFDLDRFVEDCKTCAARERSSGAIRELVARHVSDPAAVLKALGEPTRAGLAKLYHSADLTILNVIWAPRMTLLPHDHRMWAVIGIYTGREDNIFWCRKGGEYNRIEASGARALSTKETDALPDDVIHSVTNPIPRLTGAIHVYGGDFFGTPRSEWDPERLSEEPCDIPRIMRLFEDANAAYPEVLKDKRK